MGTQSVREQALRAREASQVLGVSEIAVRNGALHAMADALSSHEDEILRANQDDIDRARRAQTRESLIDRLMLNHQRLVECADALRQLAHLDDVLGEVIDRRVIACGIEMEKIRVPLGVIGMIYEARPNVTCDAAGIGIKTGNAMLLRGGSLAASTNAILIRVLSDACVTVGLPDDSLQAIDASDRATATEMMGLRGLIDLLIPRGGAGLIASIVENSKVPVIETGTGNCHVYIEKSADLDMARAIVINAKCQRPSVCNAAESLLVDRAIASDAFKTIIPALIEAGVEVLVDKDDVSLAQSAVADETIIGIATAQDFATEFLDMKISVKVVEDILEAIEHINRFGTMHSEAIVTADQAAAELFIAQVDASTVYVNASTRFTDGGLFGLGAEIGISTQKTHARGPFALEALTSTKYVCRGTGQVRT